MANTFGDANHGTNTIGLNQGGPHGLGDPNDRRLRKVEIEVLIPKIMRERAKTEKCVEEVRQFEVCCKDTGILMTIKCQTENKALKACSLKWYNDEQFKAECREIYLEERAEYRRTGLPKKFRNLDL
ncbi:COX assembly mitochondrial protein homolog [Wyeomyia smithii]|uniref:COX assembly mitochondrial protein homolog n=1 Tax=Wyeomyia smithii TaxID=174621 RepID=UPI002467C946|nr:COX assembly mitochondrial protein homolog [Wyeomyia smithii]